LIGFLTTLTDVKTDELFELTVVGNAKDPLADCESFKINVKEDFLESIKVLYKNDGIFGLVLSTLHNHKKAIGSITEGLKEALFTAGPGEVFIGFAGTTVAD
jgi:hypothetical protein